MNQKLTNISNKTSEIVKDDNNLSLEIFEYILNNELCYDIVNDGIDIELTKFTSLQILHFEKFLNKLYFNLFFDS